MQDAIAEEYNTSRMPVREKLIRPKDFFDVVPISLAKQAVAFLPASPLHRQSLVPHFSRS